MGWRCSTSQRGRPDCDAGRQPRALTPERHLIYTAGGTLRAVSFDLDRLETRLALVMALPRLVRKAQVAAEFVVAADGTLAYVDAPDFAAANTLVWVDRQGREKPIDAPPGAYAHPRVSPDGMRVAVREDVF